MALAELLSELDSLAAAAAAAFAGAADKDALETARVEFLGAKSGRLKSAQKGLGSVPPADKPEAGKRFNEVKRALEEALAAAQARLEKSPAVENIAPFDPTLPGVRPRLGHLHPITQTINELKEIMGRLGFTVADGPEIEDERHNFKALNIPADHPARDPLENFYLSVANKIPHPGPRREGAAAARGQTAPLLLRSQTSTVQIRVMEHQPPPVRIIAVGRVYRPDTADATHFPMFHQIEGLLIDRNVTMADLKSVLRLFAESFLGRDVHIRFRPSFFPFTEPSVEVDMSWGERWIEMGGAGMVDPAVLQRGRLRSGRGDRLRVRPGRRTGLRPTPRSGRHPRVLQERRSFSPSILDSNCRMIVSFNWLKEYVALDVGADELARRLMLAGLNHEQTTPIGDDFAIDLEITSNRPDCLGHVGVAREAAVLLHKQLTIPAAALPPGKTPAADLARVTIDSPELCPRYTARIIRGVKVGPSPAWLVRRLATIGIAAINNVVDITNFVLMECGQPLHAFDLGKLEGRQIVVRSARAGEMFDAINHKRYTLEPGMCVIADRSRPVALGGVMGGADTEVSAATADLLIESADFNAASIRATARKLALHSDSSYRFERGVDPEGIEWASRRACELILQIAGGELAAGVIDVGRKPSQREPITFRFNQLKRILGIDIPAAEARQILAALGNRELRVTEQELEIVPPTWRRDLSREIDLVEEVARIWGYDAIPEDVKVPMAPSARTPQDRVLEKVRAER